MKELKYLFPGFRLRRGQRDQQFGRDKRGRQRWRLLCSPEIFLLFNSVDIVIVVTVGIANGRTSEVQVRQKRNVSDQRRSHLSHRQEKPELRRLGRQNSRRRSGFKRRSRGSRLWMLRRRQRQGVVQKFPGSQQTVKAGKTSPEKKWRRRRVQQQHRRSDQKSKRLATTSTTTAAAANIFTTTTTATTTKQRSLESCSSHRSQRHHSYRGGKSETSKRRKRKDADEQKETVGKVKVC